MHRSFGVFASALVVLTACTTAHGFVSWTNANGMADDFSWENGGSDNGLYGDPTLVGGNTLVFFPSNFRADSADGVSGSASDRLVVDIIAKADNKITEIVISEFGDYGITGTGSVNLTASLMVTDLNDLGRVETDALTTSPLMPITFGSGNWSAAGGIDLSALPGADWIHIRLELTNVLDAFTDAGSTSFIEKKVAGTGIQIMVIPTPGSAVLFASATLLVGRRRR